MTDEAQLTWVEICARFPDQFVCLVDVIPVEVRSPSIARARVIGRGLTRRDASAPIRDGCDHRQWKVVFTGSCDLPIRRPPGLLE